MSQPPLLCIHGYGVRGFFWNQLKKSAAERGIEVHAPDLKLETLEAGIVELAGLVRAFSAQKHSKVVLVGHSLGGILSALAAERLDDSVLAGVVIISSPFGATSVSIPPVLRFLLRWHLLPGWVVRPSFFGPNIPNLEQKELFKKAVRESRAIQKITLARSWFDKHPIAGALPHKSLAIASESDKIVTFQQTLAFAAAIGAESHVFPASLQIGHDDIAVNPKVADMILDLIKAMTAT